MPGDKPVSPVPPWQFLVRAGAVVTGLALLVLDVRGTAHYVAVGLIVLALAGELAGTLAHWRHTRERR